MSDQTPEVTEKMQVFSDGMQAGLRVAINAISRNTVSREQLVTMLESLESSINSIAARIQEAK